MQTIRVRQRLNSETLTLPQLRSFVGKDVEIVVSDVSPVSDETPTTNRSPLAGSVLWYDDPFEPAVPAEEWEANQ